MKKNVNEPKPIAYTHQWKVARSAALLEYLLGKLDLSRNSVKNLLGGHKVLVNGSVVTKFDYPLAKDDEVKIAKNPVRDDLKKDKAAGPKTPERSPFKKWIIYEDDEFLAINKPSGLLSVESDKNRESAYSYASAYLKAKDPKARPYILHRIDKDTSGVLVFAKDIKLHSMLKMHWNEDIKLRKYIAVVSGKMSQKEGRIVSFLKENINNLVYVSEDRGGKKAITNYKVLKENPRYSMLDVVIETGRKNQIRVQLENLGHPVIGDEKYGEGENPIGRLGLHASELIFIHPVTKQKISLIAPVPKEFNKLF
ncbi:MAG: RluA family pseudouridine synthase [Erysipelotrichaceae bacterium]|nr:RluA family pseudouridine synthase [Erysipelotrichaceae bacterium]